MTMLELVAVTGAWIGFFLVMWATAREEGEKKIHELLAGIPATIAGIFAAWALSQGIRAPDAPLVFLGGAAIAGAGAALFQDWRYKRA